MGIFTELTQYFGIGYGYNADITLQGASQWLRKIPIDKQKEIYYYTTEGGVCHVATVIIITKLLLHRRNHVRFCLNLYWMAPMMKQWKRKDLSCQAAPGSLIRKESVIVKVY